MEVFSLAYITEIKWGFFLAFLFSRQYFYKCRLID